MKKKNILFGASLAVFISVLGFVFFEPVSASSKTFLVDFGRQDLSTSVSGWNNITNPSLGTNSNLVDSTGASSSLNLQISNAFVTNASYPTYSANNGGTTASTVYPASATRDSFYLTPYGTTADTAGQITISGLNNDASYTFKFFASRVDSSTAARTAQYTIGTKSSTLNATNNVNSIAQIQDVVPTNGSIVINVSILSGSSYAYLGALEIVENSSTTPTNINPVANAGLDQSILLPINSVTFSGSGTDTDGSIVGYSWSRISGTGAITSPSSASTTITGLLQGTSVFQLTVIDNQGALGTDTVSVVVNPGTPSNVSPSVNAGTDQTITLPISSVTLTGSATDTDGTISSYSWTKISGTGGTITSPSSASTTIIGLSAGSYTFRLSVTDDDGAVSSDTLVVVVNPQTVGVCPVPQKIVILGSSTAAGNAASSYQNSWAGRLATYGQSQNPGGQIINLGMSTYTTYHILATGSSTPLDRPTPDTARNITRALSYSPDAIIINMPTNDAANGYSLAEQQANFISLAQIAADAGVDLWITTTQPRNLNSSQRAQLITMRDWINQQFGLKAVDFWTTVANADGTINSTYNSGDGIHLNDAGHLVLFNSLLSENIYDVLCTANSNVSPSANAGTDQSITLPISYLTLTGSGTDSDGTISSYSWTKVSTLAGTITSPSSASTTITGLAQGTHTFRLTVTDNGGLTASDDVVVVVNADPLLQSATTIAGYNAIVHLPGDYGQTGTKQYPLILFFPGLSEAGTGNVYDLLSYGPSAFIAAGNPMEFNVNGVVEKPIVISVQTGQWPQPSIINTILSNITSQYRVDSARIYLTGLSMGGWTVDTYVSENETYANKIAAVVAVQPAGMDNPVSQMSTFASAGGKWWGIRGINDVWGTEVPTIVTNMNSLSPGSARGTTVASGQPGSTHCCWNTFYDPVTWATNSSNSYSESIYEWMLKQSKNFNQAPTISFDPITINLSANVVDTDGTISSYLWTKVSGTGGTITSPSSASTTITGLSAGSYTFRLSVTDDDGAVVSKDFQFSF